MPSPNHATAPHNLYERASLLLTEFSIQNHVMLSAGQREWLIKNMVALATDYCKDVEAIRNRNTEES